MHSCAAGAPDFVDPDGALRLVEYRIGPGRSVCIAKPNLVRRACGLSWLSIAGDSPRGFLCPTLGATKISGRSGLSKQFAALMATAGIDQRQIQSSRNRKFSKLSYHSLRHSFSSALANVGFSADVRMKLTGHKNLDVHQRYTHVQLEPLRRAVALLPKLSR